MKNNSKGLDVESIISDIEKDYKIEGSLEMKITDVASLGGSTCSHLSFCSSEGNDAIKLISQSNAGIILCKRNLEGLVHPRHGTQLIFLDNPRLAFVHIFKKIHNERKVGISSRSVISKNAEICDDCYIGDYVVIGDNCKVGKNTVIQDRVSLVQNCIIGDNCIIQSGVTLGDDGFSFERYPTKLERFPHIGSLIIGNNVEICANSHIARGSLSDTIIGNGTKIDALVHVAHNVVMGENCEIAGGAVFGGSITVGNSTWIGLNATLKNKIKIGNNVLVASGASVINDVLDGDIVAGVPAKSIKHKVTLTDDKLYLMTGKKEDEKKMD